MKPLGVGLAIVVVLATVVVAVVVVTSVLACPGCGALGTPGCCDCAWTWASARLPGVVMDPCIFTGGSRDCWPYSIYCTHRIWKVQSGRLIYLGVAFFAPNQGWDKVRNQSKKISNWERGRLGKPVYLL